eukprot:6802111-Pyramimonas_sp.AAC.1
MPQGTRHSPGEVRPEFARQAAAARPAGAVRRGERSVTREPEKAAPADELSGTCLRGSGQCHSAPGRR